MWIKICGNTNFEDARSAVEAGADALGFVFAPSPRQVTNIQAQRIAAELAPRVERYGVFVSAPFAEIVATVEACGLTGVQLHRIPDKTLPARLRRHFAAAGQKLNIVPVLNFAAETNGDRLGAPDLNFDRALAEANGDAAIDTVLVDSSSAAAAGGTGVSFDWPAAQPSFLRAAGKLRIILAGGLRPENVKHAIATLRPWGVDVVSGVEAAPGKKDLAKLVAFIQTVREAEAGLPGPK